MRRASPVRQAGPVKGLKCLYVLVTVKVTQGITVLVRNEGPF